MFRNGPEVDGGGTAYLGPTTIIEMTIPMSQSSSCILILRIVKKELSYTGVVPATEPPMPKLE